MSMNRRAGRRPGRGASSGLVWTPKAITGLQLWLRADLGVTIGTGVSAWADQSGTGDANKNVTQATGSKQPTLNASDANYNNKPTLSFSSAASQCLVSGLWASPLSQPWTVVAVGQDDGTVSAQVYVESGSDLAGSNRVLVYQNATNYELNAGAALVANARDATPHGLVGVVNGVSSRIYNSARTAVATGDAGARAPLGATFIGETFADTAFLNGKIAEVIVWSGALSDAQLAPVWNYIASRYAITVGA